MARIIPEEFWREAFLLPDGRYDGNKFEALTLHLLEALYGQGWQQTAGSHDGSRDFEKRDDKGCLWAECKAYAEKLSIYVISPTLVMALIEDPHTVIVVSRSDLNNNAVRHLSSYQMASGKRIISFDGRVLDHAILGTNLYPLYFQGLPTPRPMQPEIQVRYSLTSDVLIDPTEQDFTHYAGSSRSNRSVDTVRFGLLRLDFSLKNLSAMSGSTVRLELLKETLNPSLRIISFGGHKRADSISVRIPPAGIVRTSLIVQPCEANERLMLPSLCIKGKGAPSLPIKTGTAHVSHLFQIGMVGRNHRSTLEQAGGFLRSRRRSTVITIEGASGTGKSRLLQEIAKLGLEEGFRCHFYNPEFEDAKSADQVVRNLVADLSELPLMVGSADEQQPDSYYSASDTTSFLTRILFDNTFPIWDHINEVVAAIISLLGKKRTLLIIDNVQFTNENFVELLEALVIQLQHQRNKRVALVFSFNTDFVRSESRFGMLLAKLSAWSNDANQSHAFYHSCLKDFDIDDVAEFIETAFSGKHCTGSAARLYELTLQLFIQQVQPRPLNIWQSLMYLVDEGIIFFEGECLKFTGDESLISRLSYIPRNLNDLLSLRWVRIGANEAKSGTAQSELEATVRAAYLLGNDSRDRLIALGATKRAIDGLLRTGILLSQAGGRIQFFHNQVFNFFRERYLVIEKEIAIKLKVSFESLHLTGTKFQQYLILCHFAEDVNRPVLVSAVRRMEDKGLTIDYWRQYTDILLHYLTAIIQRPGATSVKGVALIGEWQQRFESLQRGAETLRDFLVRQLLPNSRKTIPGDYLFHFYTATANACLSIYDDAQALEVISIALNDLKRSRFPNDEKRNEALATILNRKAATLKNFGNVEEALDAGREALRNFRELGNHSMVVESLFDIASVLMRTPERRPEGWHLLEEGRQLFQLHRKAMLEPAPCRYFYISAELAINHRKFIDAYRYCEDGFRHAEQVGNRFWGIRLLLLEVVAHLLAGDCSSTDFERVNRLIIKARDWANISHAERSRWALAYLDGKFRAQTGNYTLASKSLSEALAALASKLRTPEQLAWRSSLIRDIAATCRRHRLILDEHAISMLASYAIQYEIKNILVMSDEAFAQFERSHVSEVLFSHDGETLELP